MQQQLKICEDWATELKMTWNPPKCVIIGLRVNEPDLMLCGTAIPRWNSGKDELYVGFNIGPSGIHWQKSMDRLIGKAEGVLKSLNHVGSICNAATRVHLVKACVQSITDYAVAACHAWMDKKRNERYSAIMSKLNDLHLKCMSFISGTRSSKNVHVVESMAMLAPPEIRALQMRTSAVEQLSRLENCPLLTLANDLQREGSILLDLMHWKRNPMTKAFVDLNNARATVNLNTVPMNVLAKQWTAFHLSRRDDRHLQCYVLPGCRKKPTGMDRVMFEHNAIFMKACAWRRNLAFMKCYCVCGTGFTRRHVEECPQLIESIAPRVDLSVTKQLLMDRNVPVDGYTSLDEWLNRAESAKFCQLYDTVSIVEDMDGVPTREPRAGPVKPSSAGYVKGGVPTLLRVAESLAEWCAQQLPLVG